MVIFMNKIVVAFLVYETTSTITFLTVYSMKLLSFIVIVPPLIAAIVAGRVGEKRIHSFLGVFLTSLVSMIVSMILMFSSVSYQIIITSEFMGSGALFIVVLGSLLNGLIFGLLAFFTTKRK